MSWILSIFLGCSSVAAPPQKSENELAVLRQKLSPIQYNVTQENGTEPAFKNAYWNNKEAGVYVDIVSGEPLFSSTHKFDSGTGWPSFYRSLEDGNIVERIDRSHLMNRVEVRSKQADSHLGHLFDDSPSPSGLRYCINSASLRFVPVSKLEEQGLGSYLYLFESKPFSNEEIAVLAGGCFWGMEGLIRKLPGVLDTEVGYAGGKSKSPTYNTVKGGNTGHAESIWVQFDNSRLSYPELLDFFFTIHDPTTINRQGNDRGSQYRSAIFAQSPRQLKQAKAAIEKAQNSGMWSSPVVTEVSYNTKFTKGESYHQDYLVKNPNGYTCHYIRE